MWTCNVDLQEHYCTVLQKEDQWEVGKVVCIIHMRYKQSGTYKLFIELQSLLSNVEFSSFVHVRIQLLKVGISTCTLLHGVAATLV